MLQCFVSVLFMEGQRGFQKYVSEWIWGRQLQTIDIQILTTLSAV